MYFLGLFYARELQKTYIFGRHMLPAQIFSLSLHSKKFYPQPSIQ